MLTLTLALAISSVVLSAVPQEPAPAAGPKVASANVLQFGAKGDGEADDTAAIQRALDAVAGANGVAHLPAGSYKLSATLVMPHGTTLLGEGVRWENSATKLIVPSPGFAAVRLQHGCSVKGMLISYPNNRKNAAPVEYPPAILLGGINPSVEDITFDCAWDGVASVPGIHTGQGLFRNLTGFIHNVGIHLSGIRDIVRIENVHWFVGGDDHGEKAYYRNNRIGFRLGDVDGLIMSKCFIIGGKTFLHQLATKDVTEGDRQPAHSLGIHVEQSWIEDVENGFVFEGTSGFVVHSANILVRKGGVGIRVTPDNLFYNAVIGSVQVRSFGEPIRGIEYGIQGGNKHIRNRLSITDCQIVDGAPAIHLLEGAVRASIHHNHLQTAPGHPAIKIDPGADLFVVTDNILSSETAIYDQTDDKARKIIRDNLVETPKPEPPDGSKP